MKNIRHLALYSLVLLLSACDNTTDTNTYTQQLIVSGRNESDSLERPDVYTAEIPLSWRVNPPNPNESLTDTMKPIYEITINDEQEHIEITIHNFPVAELGKRIPPEAQAARWRQQLGGDAAQHISVENQAFGGFSGLRFEGEGALSGKERKVIGWTMQMSPEHFYALSQEHEGLSEKERLQMSASYTIKVVGPPEVVQKNIQAINKFARTFRLINPIPQKR